MEFDKIPNLQAMMLEKLDHLDRMMNLILEKLDLAEIPKESTTEEYFTVSETAKFLDTSVHYVYTLKKRIPHVLRGNRLYYKKSDLIAYMEAGRTKAQGVKRR